MALPPAEIGKRIRAVREQIGVSPEELANALGTDLLIVRRLEEGTLDPLPGDYVLIAARVLKADFRYFISDQLDDVENETRQVFRSIQTPSPADARAIRRFMLFCTAEAELEKLIGVDRPSLCPTYPAAVGAKTLHKEQGSRAALQERQRLGLRLSPIKNIFEILRSQGVRLFRQALENGQLSGVTILHPVAGVCVLVNYDEDLYRQFFSASHEFGHVLFDREEIGSKGCVVSYRYNNTDLAEIRANNFAAEFLLPSAAVSQYPKPHGLNELNQTINRIAIDYGVNAQTVAIAAKKVGWITQKTLDSFMQARPVRIGPGHKHDPDMPNNLTHTQADRWQAAFRQGLSPYYLRLLREALIREEITLGRFAEMLDMTIEEATSFIQAAGIAT